MDLHLHQENDYIVAEHTSILNSEVKLSSEKR